MQMAMSILVRMAEAAGAPSLIDIVGAHIDSAIYLGEATLAFAERLASLGARVCVPTSLNVSGVDEMGWRDWAVPPEWAGQAARQMEAYRQMGCAPTWTCAPYQTNLRPRFGDQIAWGESNAIAFANTAIGARSERYPDLLDICAAITGRVPALGLHLTEHRAGQLLVQLVDLPRSVQQEDTFYPLLGHLLGRIAGERIPVVTGLDAEVHPTEDQLKALCAAAASSGAVALLHLVGVTPEAPTLDAAFHGRPATDVETHEIGMPRLRAAWRDLSTAEGTDLDLVVLGSPHFSLAEFAQLAPLLAGRHRHDRVRLLVTTSRIMRDLAEAAGHLAHLRDFGGQVTVDTCILATPMLQPGIRTLMTNSAKYAYYAPGLLGTRVVFGRMADCIASAETGRVVRTPSVWD
jgi:predicted aconitase